MENLNYLFNKAYYRNLGNPKFEIDVKQFNTCIEKTKFNMSDYKPLPFDCQTIVMKIGYPGLIIGMGNPHGVGTKDFKWKDDIKFNKEPETFRIVGKLKERLHKFLSDEDFEDVLRYAVNDVLGLGWKNNKSTDEQTDDTIFDKITDEQIASVRNCLSNDRKPNIVFVNSKRKTIRFNSFEELKKLAERIVDMCISGNEEIKTGFSFDYTTGQPYIPASSVKGMLRSYFKEHRQAVCEIIKAKTGIEFTKSEIELLESDIFDYPIRILKINPGVQLEFRFLLNDHTVNDKTVTKDMLKDIFTELLSLFGVGAKTNVGYGILKDIRNEPLEEMCDANGTVKVKCPYCGKWTYKYQQNSDIPNKNCKNNSCRKPLNLGG